MGFHSVMGAACNKNRGYRSDDSVIRTKDRDYRCVKNGAILSVAEAHCSGTRHSGSVIYTAEDD